MTAGDPKRIDVIIPQVGEAVAEVTLVRWLKQPGDRVSRGEVLFEVDTAKAVLEVEAYEDGVLEEIVVPEGAAVAPLQRVAVLRADTTVRGDTTVSRAAADSRPAPAPPLTSASQVAREEASGPTSRETGAPGRPYSPKARRLARELGVDPANVTGTGEGGMVTTADVERAATLERAASSVSRPPLSKIRAAMAARTQASKQRVPHFYLLADVEMSAALRLRAAERSADATEPPSITALVVRACAVALAANPEFNASFVGDALVPRTSIGIGVAVETDQGLLVPVIPDAGNLGLRATALAVRDVAQRARDGRLRPQDVAPKSMVVSNLGMHGVPTFIAIIDEPDPFILAVGQVRDAVIPVDGAPAIRPVATLALSVDHRAFDGVEAARFFRELRRRLERADAELR